MQCNSTEQSGIHTHFILYFIFALNLASRAAQQGQHKSGTYNQGCTIWDTYKFNFILYLIFALNLTRRIAQQGQHKSGTYETMRIAYTPMQKLMPCWRDLFVNASSVKQAQKGHDIIESGDPQMQRRQSRQNRSKHAMPNISKQNKMKHQLRWTWMRCSESWKHACNVEEKKRVPSVAE